MEKEEEGPWEYSEREQSDKVEQNVEEEGFEEVEPDWHDIWVPEEKGDSLSGSVLDIQEGAYGIEAILETADGEIIRTPAHKILQSRIEKIAVGDFVRIVYLGTNRTKGGRKVNDYRLLRKVAFPEKGSAPKSPNNV